MINVDKLRQIIDKLHELQRVCKKLEKGEMPTGSYKSTGLVFITEQGELIADYVVNASKMFHGLLPSKTKQLAFEYAKTNCINYPHSWDANSCAGLDWFSGFTKRHNNLFTKKTEATSLARTASFNSTNVNLFFDNWPKCLTNI